MIDIRFEGVAIDPGASLIRQDWIAKENWEKEEVLELHLPERVFYSLDELDQRWAVSTSVLSQWLMHGVLQAHVWIPVMSVYQISGADVSRLCHWEGYAQISRHQCRRLFKTKHLTIRQLVSEDGSNRYQIPDTAEDLVVGVSDVIVLKDECERFESRYDIDPSLVCPTKTRKAPVAPSFRIVRFKGKDYSFGQMQSAVLVYLYEAAVEGDPWKNGKRLLSEVGSQSFSVANLFKRQPIWRELIQSDRRGTYRLQEAFLSTLV